MNGVIGMADLLLDTPLNREQWSFVTTLRGSAEALLYLLNDILDFSKIEAGKLEVEQLPFDPREVTEQVVAASAERAQGKGLEVVFKVTRELPAAILGDAFRVRQVLNNLVSNAIKFTEQGEVVIAASTDPARLPASAAPSPGEIAWCVCDSGIGMDAGTQARLFAAFTQADATTTRRFGGTGLGLAISRQLVHLMGGRIGVESAPGRGSAFWFVLPAPPADLPSHPAPEVDLNGKSAMVVMSNDSARVLLMEELTELGAGVGGAATCDGIPEQALLAGDFLFVDADQWETLPATTDERPMPARIQLTPMKRSAVAQAEYVLHKPVMPGELRHMLHDILTGRAAGDGLVAPADAAPLGARVLVVEDNDINRQIAQTILDKLGCTVTTAVNGAQAVELVGGTRFDVVLMDCQMPVMDGYEASRRIRDLEAERRSTQPLPIVALTANALTGDRELCLQAGMTDYLSKPFKVEQLRNVLRRYLPGVAGRGEPGSGGDDPFAANIEPAGSSVPREADSAPPVFSREVLMDFLSMEEPARRGDLARELLDMFLEDSARQLEQLGQALAASDHGLARRVAHTLKSSSASMGAMRLSALCKQAEEILRDTGRLDEGDWLDRIGAARRAAGAAITSLPPDWLDRNAVGTP
jgi:CheY-like chemotaxis protein/HPt (histidine-containing phosphotransfer) domain-containing protein/anti-sigma regulatory factor (Ser/Thr protein kinase)